MSSRYVKPSISRKRARAGALGAAASHRIHTPEQYRAWGAMGGRPRRDLEAELSRHEEEKIIERSIPDNLKQLRKLWEARCSGSQRAGCLTPPQEAPARAGRRQGAE